MDLGLGSKVVVVTGGGSNIGRATSLTFAKEGANVAIVDLDETQGQKTAGEANALNGGGRTVVHKMDVTNLQEVQEVFKKVKDEFGKIDVLVNNVGRELGLMFFNDTTTQMWDIIIDVNYRGVLNCTKAVLPYMIDQKGGAIVSIGSDAGRMGDAKEAVYGGCKGGVIAFTKAVARENGRYGIRLNVVCPGATIPGSKEEVGDQSMWALGPDMFTPEIREQWSKKYALRRLGTPQEVANAVVFLGSDAASFITGQTLSASGGYSMM